MSKTKNILFGKTYCSGERWLTVARFEIGLVWLSASIFEDDQGNSCMMWPAMRGRGAAGGWKKTAGCTDIETRDEVEREVLAEYRKWRETHALPEKSARGGETFLTMKEYIRRVLNGEPYDDLMDQLGPRDALRVYWLLLRLGMQESYIPKRDALLFAAIYRQLMNADAVADKGRERRRLKKLAAQDEKYL